MTSGSILVVDDDPDILKILKDNLELDGYQAHTAASGKEALRSFENVGPRLVILDLSLPDIDGIQVCRWIREKSDVPIIMLTARDGLPDKVLGLETGADDYVVKPFDYLELAARIRACLRRQGSFLETEEILIIGPLEIDTATKTLRKHGQRITLTHREFNLLLLLARHRGRALSRTAIRHELWPEGEVPRDTRTIDVHVQHLRSKIEDDAGQPRYIVTVPGVGYMFAASEE